MIASMDSAIRRVRHRPILPWVVLAIGVLAALLSFTVLRDAVESVARLRFERQTSDAHSVIKSRLRFHRFVESLDLKHRYPGFDALNFAAYVPAKDKKRFEEEVRGDTSLDPKGYPRFAIVPPGERSEYYVLVYLEPLLGYEFAF